MSEDIRGKRASINNIPSEWVALSLGMISSFQLVSCTVNNTLPDHPNVILIVLDDMNNYAVSRAENVKTPFLDKIRRQSVTFSHANCPAPLSMPSRASFFTGIYPHNSGVYANGGDPWNNSEVLRKAETLPELFKRNGYYTFGRGKIYHARMEEGRLERNFDNTLVEGGFGPFPDSLHRVHSGRDIFSEFWGVQSYPDSLFPDIINTGAVINYLNEKHDKPFFITLGLWRPHTPFTAPQRFFDMYDTEEIRIPEGYLKNDLDDVPGFGRSLLDPFGRFDVTGINNQEGWKNFIHGYYACTSFADWNVGRVIEALEKSDYTENTIVIIFSDNGFHIGTKNHWEKNTLWDGSAEVPLIIKVPDSDLCGQTIDTPVGLIDIYPTLTELCRLKPPVQYLDGQSLVPLLMKSGNQQYKPVLTSLGENLVSIRSDKYRYIQYPDGDSELYDIDNDPFEWNNLIGKEGTEELVKEHQKYIPAVFVKELPGIRRN